MDALSELIHDTNGNQPEARMVRPRSAYAVMLFNILVCLMSFAAAYDIYWMGGRDLTAAALVLLGLVYLGLGIGVLAMKKWAWGIQLVLVLAVVLWNASSTVQWFFRDIMPQYNLGFITLPHMWDLLFRGLLRSGPRLVVNLLLFILLLRGFLSMNTKRAPAGRVNPGKTANRKA